METWDAIRSRRNVREFSDRPIDEESLERIMEAARRTPSSGNTQPWDFVVLTDSGTLKRLAKVWKGASHVAGAKAAIGIVGRVPEDDPSSRPFDYDFGQATMSVMLAAADLGIGSAHAAVKDHNLARQILGLPHDRICAWLISLGYPLDRPLRPIANPDRRPLDELIHWTTW